MGKKKKITVQDVDISIIIGEEDYICITDMANSAGDDNRAADVIKNWLRSRSTLEFLGAWESIYNPNFKVVEFDHFRNKSGVHSFTLSPKQWKEANPSLSLKGKNIRDIASINELAVLSNMQSLNAVMIQEGADKKLRFKKLFEYAQQQLTKLNQVDFMKSLKYTTDATYIDSYESPQLSVSSAEIIPTDFDKKLKRALDYNPKESS